MAVPLIAAPEQATKIVVLPSHRRELNEIEYHVLARVAIHTCNHDGAIPYIAPTFHQYLVALALAAPDTRLLLASSMRWDVSFETITFRLSRLGWRMVQRLYRLLPLEDVMDREILFDRMRALMRNEWEG